MRLRHARRSRVWDRDLAAGRARRGSGASLSAPPGVCYCRADYWLSSGEAEADLIARDGEDLVIVEVKTRETAEYGPPEGAVNLGSSVI